VPSRVAPKFCQKTSVPADPCPRERALEWRGRGLHPMERGTWTAGSPGALPDEGDADTSAGDRRPRTARTRLRHQRRRERQRRYRLGAYLHACVAGLFRLI
jgi:hypothetical protein